MELWGLGGDFMNGSCPCNVPSPQHVMGATGSLESQGRVTKESGRFLACPEPGERWAIALLEGYL